MRSSRNLKRDEFLSGQQITSYFLDYARRKTTKEKYEAAIAEGNKDAIKTSIVRLLA